MESLSHSNNNYAFSYRAIAQTFLPATLLTLGTAYITCAVKGRSLTKPVIPLNGKWQPALAVTAMAVSYLVLCKSFAGPFRVEVVSFRKEEGSSQGSDESQASPVPIQEKDSTHREPQSEVEEEELPPLAPAVTEDIQLSSAPIGEKDEASEEPQSGVEKEQPPITAAAVTKVSQLPQVKEVLKEISAAKPEKCIQELKGVNWGEINKVIILLGNERYELNKEQVEALLILLDTEHPKFVDTANEAEGDVVRVWGILNSEKKEDTPVKKMRVQARKPKSLSGDREQTMFGSLVLTSGASSSSAAPVPNKKVIFDENIHGWYGIKMKYKGYEALLAEYCENFKVGYGKPISEVLNDSQLDPLVREVLQLVTCQIKKANLQDQYVAFCQAHRRLIESYQGKKGVDVTKTINISRALAYARFMANIQTYQSDYVKQHVGELPEFTAKDFHTQLAKLNSAVDNADPRLKVSGKNLGIDLLGTKLNGEISLANYFEVNPPNLRSIETWGRDGSTRNIFHLRHSTPHTYFRGEQSTWAPYTLIDGAAALLGASYQTMIDPVYTEFLKFAGDRNQGVLYACHQKIMDTNEGTRCAQIIELENNHPNLLLLFQSVEFPLFMDGAKTFAELKKRLFASFDEGVWNRLPTQLQKDEIYKKEMEEIFDFVHEIFFKKKQNIDQARHKIYRGIEDRHDTTQTQAFLMLFYHYQREHLKFYKNANYQFDVAYVNTGCKDNFDRGFNNNCTTDRIHQTGLYGNKVLPELLKATATSGPSVTLFGKGIGFLPKRVHPALLVSKILSEMSPEDQGKICRLERGWKLIGCGLPLKRNQPATA